MFITELLKNATTYEEINEYRNTIIEHIPAVQIMFDYDQKNTSHQYDLWGHCVHTVLNLPKGIDDDMLYLAALLHDIGKPDCQCDGSKPDDTNKHYYGHPERSAEIVSETVLPYLEKIGVSLSEKDRKRLLYYVEFHDDRVSLRIKHLRRHLKMVSFEEFKKLMILQVADARAHVMIPIIEERVDVCSQWAGEHGEKMYKRLQEGW